MQFRLPRGTQDILPEDQPYWDYVTSTAREQARRFGYGQIDTPVFEHSGLFQRGVGEGTDIVEKETYTFPDRSGEEITLRPEGTAPVCRAYLEHGMHNRPQPVRMHYFCPIFRYERPQAGRLRQHHQFGVEAIGDGDPSIDAEVIDLGWRFTNALGLRGLSLAVNSIGDPACRPQYLEALKAHYADRLGEACPDCRMRYERNPLRMLDCKRSDFACQDLIADAPQMAQCPLPRLRRPLRQAAPLSRRPWHPLLHQPHPRARARLLHPHRLRDPALRRRAPRASSSAAAATTASSSSSAAARRRASASAPASSGSS